MKDYKGRGSELQFRGRRRQPRVLPIAVLMLALVAAAVFFLAPGLTDKLFDTEGSPQPAARGGSGSAIPLTLPPPSPTATDSPTR